MAKWLLLMTCLGFWACGDAAPTDPSNDASVDSAATECPPNTALCDELQSTYTECSAAGTIVTQLSCPLGCDTVAGKCLDLNPSNGLAAALDMLPTYPGVRNVTLGDSQHTYYMNTDSGAVQAPGSIDIPSVIVNGIRVFLFDQLYIPGGRILVSGSRPVAFVAKSIVTVQSFADDPDFAVIDVSASGSWPGPGARPDCAAGTSTGDAGGGGGGGFEPGGVGGADFSGASGAPGGVAVRDDDLVPLRGGCRGGGVAVNPSASGGGGGGAIQIVSRVEIRFIRAGIDASGGGGDSGPRQSPEFLQPGVGGGGGGAILLEAPQVVLGGGSVLSTKGGAGAAAAFASFGVGGDGGLDANPAGCGSAQCGGCGRGGTASTSPGPGGAGPSPTCPKGGGGGGSAGQTRINTSTGELSASGGYVIRSRYTIDRLQTRLVP